MSDVAGAAESTPEVSQPVESTPAPDRTFEDTLHAEIDRVFDAADAIERGEKAPEGEAQPQQQRGPDGRFVSAAPAQAVETPKVEGQELPDVPASWSSVSAHWPALPPEVRQALIDRDGADEKSRQETGERLKNYEALERIIGPRRELWSKGFTSAEAAIEQLLELSDFAGRDKPGFVRWFCNQHGIDLASLAQAAAAQPSADPQLAALTREVQTLKSSLSQREQAEQQEQESRAGAEIARFRDQKSDKGEALHPHFDAVRESMGAILKAGAAQSLEQAYKIAVAADDKLQARIKADADKAAKAEAEAAAKEQAAKARSTVRSDLRTSSSGSASNRATLDDTLRAEINKRMSAA